MKGYLAASLLSSFPTLVHEEHHGTNGNQSIDKESIDSVTKKHVNIVSHFSHGDSIRANHQFPGIYRGSLEKRQKHKKCDLVFHQVGQIRSYRALDLPDLCRIARSTI